MPPREVWAGFLGVAVCFFRRACTEAWHALGCRETSLPVTKRPEVIHGHVRTSRQAGQHILVSRLSATATEAAQDKAGRWGCAMRCPGSRARYSGQACAPNGTCPVLALSGGLPLSRHSSAACATRRLRHRQLGNVRTHAPSVMGIGSCGGCSSGSVQKRFVGCL